MSLDTRPEAPVVPVILDLTPEEAAVYADQIADAVVTRTLSKDPDPTKSQRPVAPELLLRQVARQAARGVLGLTEDSIVPAERIEFVPYEEEEPSLGDMRAAAKLTPATRRNR